MSAITAKASRKMKKYAVLTREPRCFLGSFDFSWEQRKFGEITSKYEDPVPTPHDGYYRLGIRSHAKGTFHSYVAKGQELETAQMHRVAAGNFIVNITFGWEHAVAITDKNDAGKLVSHRFPQFSFAEGMVPEFFRYVIVDEKFRHHLWLASPGGAGRNRVLKLDEMLNYLMRFPSRDEQIKIAEFFRHLDNLITLHQRKCANLCSPSQVVFSLLFATSTFSWEQRKAKEMFVSTADKGYPELPVLSATQDRGMIRRDENSINIFHDKKNEAGYKRVLPGQFVIHLRSFQGGFAHSAIEGITSPAYTVFGFSEPEKHDSEYWKYVFTSKSFIQRLETVTYGIRDGRSISYEEFLTLGFVYPSKAEQTAIARYLDKLSDLITLHQRECISFTGRADRLILTANKKRTTSSWEQRKAIDIADYSKGNGYSKGDLTDAGTPIILYGRLYTKYQFAISEVDTFAFSRNGAVYSQGNEVIVPASGETAEDIARASAVEKSGVLLGGDLNILRPFDFINPLFLALAISNGEPQKELAKKAQGKSVVHIHNTDIQEVTIAYPSRTEQDRIVSVFRQLDNLITLHQRKPFLMKWRTSDANRNQTNRLVL